MEEKKKAADDSALHTRDTLLRVYEILKEKGYNPINQIVGFLRSEDPTYLTGEEARALVQKIDRDTILSEIVRYYLGA